MSNQAESSRPSLAESMPAQAAEFAQVCKGKGVPSTTCRARCPSSIGS